MVIYDSIVRAKLEAWSKRPMLAVFATTSMIALGGCIHQRPAPAPSPPPGDATFEELVASYDKVAEDGWEQEECHQIAAEFSAYSDRAKGVPAALFNAGMALRACGLVDEARELFKQARIAHRHRLQDKSSDYVPALVVLGLDAAQKGETAFAVKLFTKARDAEPYLATPYLNLAAIQRSEGDFKGAQMNLRRALAVDPDRLVASEQMALLYIDAARKNHNNHKSSTNSENPEMLDLATLVCQQALAKASQDKAAPERVAPLHNVWGVALIQKGDFVEGLIQFDKAWQLDPHLFEAHLNSGAVNLSFRGYEAAERAFRAACRLRPLSYDARLSIGVALRGLRRYDEAQEAYEQALDINEARPDAHYNLGVLALDYLVGFAAEDNEDQLGLVREAREHFQLVLELCARAPAGCSKQGRGEHPIDLRNFAHRRIEQCDTIIESLSEGSDSDEIDSSVASENQGGL